MLLLFLTLPALTLATIRVNVLGTFDGGNSNFTAYVGNDDVATILDKDRNAFHLDDNAIKKGFEISNGKSPDQVFVKSPTPWGDLYSQFGWKQVQRTTSLINAGLASVATKLEVIAQELLENGGPTPMRVNITLSKQIKQAMYSSWPTFDNISASGIKYRLNLDVKGSLMNFEQEFAWGESGRQSKNETLELQSESSILLQPRQTVTAQLIAKRAVMSLNFDYVTSLANDAIANYDTVYKNHHFYRLDVNAILRVIPLSEKLKSTNKILVAFYYDPQIIVKDNKTGTILIDRESPKPKPQDGKRLSGHAIHRDTIPSGKKIAFTIPDEGLSTDIADLPDLQENV